MAGLFPSECDDVSEYDESALFVVLCGGVFGVMEDGVDVLLQLERVVALA